nr:hypothetical protein MtrDRAFT_AC149130g46v2 [Medicago truncatula]
MWDMTKLIALFTFKELVVNFLVANDYHGCIQNSIPITMTKFKFMNINARSSP